MNWLWTGFDISIMAFNTWAWYKIGSYEGWKTNHDQCYQTGYANGYDDGADEAMKIQLQLDEENL